MIRYFTRFLGPPETQSRMERFAGTPVGTTVILMLTILIGVYMNRYTTEIVDASTLFRHEYFLGAYADHAVLFYLLLLLVCLLNVQAQRAAIQDRNATDARRSDAESRLLDATGDLKIREDALQKDARRVRQMLRTLPPAGFLDRFDGLHLEVHDVLVKVLYELGGENPMQATEIQREIRLVLGSIANLMRAFDSTMQAATFHANIAWYRSADWIRDSEAGMQERINCGLALVGHEIGFSSLKGVLAIDPVLSVASAPSGTGETSGTAAIDERLTPLAFPIPWVTTARVGDEMKSTVLPGAPLAWTQHEWVSYPTQDDLLMWCERHGAFPATVVPALRTYLERDGVEVQSFASVPVLRYDAKESAVPRAVLNVHCDRPGLLRRRRPVRHLVPLMAPLIVALDELLEALEDVQSAETPAATDLDTNVWSGRSITTGLTEAVARSRLLTEGSGPTLPNPAGTSLDGVSSSDPDA